MTSQRNLAQLRRILQLRRRALLEAASSEGRELLSLREQTRDPESEETAQVEVADSTLTQVVDAQRAEVGEIDAALSRMEEGTFGRCVECDQPIPFERLKALPFTRFCEEDAARREARRYAGNPAATPTL
jgi:RNA polymerase-binding transcription factor DksA